MHMTIARDNEQNVNCTATATINKISKNVKYSYCRQRYNAGMHGDYGMSGRRYGYSEYGTFYK